MITNIAPETKIWRYIDLAKLINMLTTDSLYFPCPNEFSDPFEGLLPKSHIRARYEQTKRLVDETMKDIDSNRHLIPEQDYINATEKSKKLLSNIPEYLKQFSTLFGVSCWHISEHESEAMWKLYSKSHGIAIESTVGQLAKSLESSVGVQIDKVRYLDFENAPYEEGHQNYDLFIKQLSYEHEKEIRAVIKLPIPGKGFSAPCAIDTLINAIHISPASPVYLHDVVESIFEENNLHKHKKPVLKSKLSDHNQFIKSYLQEEGP